MLWLTRVCYNPLKKWLEARLCVDKLQCRHATAQLLNRAKGFLYKTFQDVVKNAKSDSKGVFRCLISVQII